MTPTALTWSDDEVEFIYRWYPGATLVHKYDRKGVELDTITLKFDPDKPALNQVHAVVMQRIQEHQEAKRPGKPCMTSAEYVRAQGSKCPFCKSTNMEGEDFGADLGMSWQDVECLDCHSKWRDEYVLNSFTYATPITRKATAK